jgi:hypothetical protein
VAEVLSVLISPSPLEGIEITDKAQKLSEQQVNGWEKSWGAQVGLLELENSLGNAWSKQEKDAAVDDTRSLKPDAPAPQSVYYKPNAKTSEPILVKVRLRYGYRAKR